MIRDAARQQMADAAATVEEIDAGSVDADRLSDWLILDVREDHEFAAGHLPGAVSLPRSRLELELIQTDALDAASDKPALVYCGGGSRSLLAAHTLKQLGVARPVSMAGGFRAWREAGQPVTA